MIYFCSISNLKKLWPWRGLGSMALALALDIQALALALDPQALALALKVQALALALRFWP